MGRNVSGFMVASYFPPKRDRKRPRSPFCGSSVCSVFFASISLSSFHGKKRAILKQKKQNRPKSRKRDFLVVCDLFLVENRRQPWIQKHYDPSQEIYCETIRCAALVLLILPPPSAKEKHVHGRPWTCFSFADGGGKINRTRAAHLIVSQ